MTELTGQTALMQYQRNFCSLLREQALGMPYAQLDAADLTIAHQTATSIWSVDRADTGSASYYSGKLADFCTK